MNGISSYLHNDKALNLMDHYSNRYVRVMKPSNDYSDKMMMHVEPHMKTGYNMSKSGSITEQQQLPRSASEELFDTGSKFRQLPCRTFVSVGTCPYRERCKIIIYSSHLV